MRRIILFVFLASLSLFGQDRSDSLPLLPFPSERNLDSRAFTYRGDSRPMSHPGKFKGLGFEVGTIGRKNSGDPEVLGLRLMWGARLSSRFMIGHRWYLRPTLGYFFRSGGEGDISVTQRSIEGGVGFQYILRPHAQTQFLLGISNRLELASAKISALSSSGSTPMGLRYRIGPSVGVTKNFARGGAFTVDLETTFQLTSPIHPYAGLTAGMLFAL